MTQITPRLSVSGPDSDGDYELTLDASVLADYTFLSRAEADALIAALQAPMRARTRVVYACDHCGFSPTVEAETHVPRCCDRTNCNGTQRPAPPSTDPATGAL